MRFTRMSAGDTESTGCEKVSVRKTWGSPEADAFMFMPRSGACSHPVGLHAARIEWDHNRSMSWSMRYRCHRAPHSDSPRVFTYEFAITH